MTDQSFFQIHLIAWIIPPVDDESEFHPGCMYFWIISWLITHQSFQVHDHPALDMQHIGKPPGSLASTWFITDKFKYIHQKRPHRHIVAIAYISVVSIVGWCFMSNVFSFVEALHIISDSYIMPAVKPVSKDLYNYKGWSTVPTS